MNKKKKSTSPSIEKIIVFFIIILCILFPSFSIVHCSNGSPWPNARACHKMEYLPNSNQIFLFGGVYDFSGESRLTDTWLYNMNTSEWENLELEIHPSPRINHALIFEPSLNVIVLFGGICQETQKRMGDTWIFNLSTNIWKNIESSGSMVKRADGTLIYDPFLEKIILFGGADEQENKLNDMWYFDYSNSTWYEIDQFNKISSRYGHGMVYSDNQNATYIFGGRTPGGTTNDFFHYNSYSKNWTEIVINPKPGVRYWHTMEYSMKADLILIFGGRDSEYLGANILGDTWFFDFSQKLWRQIDLSTSPSPRVSSDMVSNIANGNYILFGGSEGISEFQGLDDMWEFDYITETWKKIKKNSSYSINSYPIYFLLGIVFIIYCYSWKKSRFHRFQFK